MDNTTEYFRDFRFTRHVQNRLKRGGKKMLRGLLAEAFRVFHHAGAWMVLSEGKMEWVLATSGHRYWGEELPVHIRLEPPNFVRAWADYIDMDCDATGRLFPNSRASLLADLSRWQDAVSEVQRRIETLPDTGGGHG